MKVTLDDSWTEFTKTGIEVWIKKCRKGFKVFRKTQWIGDKTNRLIYIYFNNDLPENCNLKDVFDTYSLYDGSPYAVKDKDYRILKGGWEIG